MIDFATELRLEFRQWIRCPDESKKPELLKNLQETVFPKYLPILEGIVKETPGNFITGDKLCWHDLFIANWLEVWGDLIIGKDGLQNYPALKGLKEAVFEVPQIKDYVTNKRPKTFI